MAHMNCWMDCDAKFAMDFIQKQMCQNACDPEFQPWALKGRQARGATAKELVKMISDYEAKWGDISQTIGDVNFNT